MRLIGLAVVLAFSFTLAPLAAEARQRGNIPRLCFLTFDPSTLQTNRFGPFFQSLRDLGYADSRPSTSTTFLQMATASDFPHSPPTACDSRRTSSSSPLLRPPKPRRTRPARSQSS